VSSRPLDPVAALALLGDRLRRRLYDFVREQRDPVSRDDVAHDAGVSRKLAAFHLDKLVDGGLLQVAAAPEVPTRRLGRPPKRYRPAPVAVAVSIPQRRYDLIGKILVKAIAAPRRSESALDAAVRAGREAGIRLGRERIGAQRPGRLGPERTISEALGALGDLGFEPARTPDGGLILRNCPFQMLAREAPDVVCAVNHAFATGLIRGLGNDRVSVALAPRLDRCCVTLDLPTGSA
jgi:predicted ArsR family transcriptional regulator